MDKIAVNQIRDYEVKKAFLNVENIDGEEYATGIAEYVDLGFYEGIHNKVSSENVLKLLDALKTKDRQKILGELQTIIILCNESSLSGEILFLMMCDVDKLIDYCYSFLVAAQVEHKEERLNNSDLCKKLRKENGLTQVELAEKSGLGIATIRRLETGNNVSDSTIKTISEFFNVPFDAFSEYSDESDTEVTENE